MERELNAIVIALAAAGITDMNTVMREAILKTNGRYNATDIYYYIKHKLGK